MQANITVVPGFIRDGAERVRQLMAGQAACRISLCAYTILLTVTAACMARAGGVQDGS